jgi:hypothetical protein
VTVVNPASQDGAAHRRRAVGTGVADVGVRAAVEGVEAGVAVEDVGSVAAVDDVGPLPSA